MSTRTTSASPASAIRCAVVAPTLPAPMTVTLLRAMWCSIASGGWSVSALGVRRGIHLDRPRRADGLGNASGVLLEVGVEHAGDPAGGRIVGVRIGPRVARPEDPVGDAGDGDGNRDPEDGVLDVRDTVEVAVDRGPDHVPGVGDVHPLA